MTSGSDPRHLGPLFELLLFPLLTFVPRCDAVAGEFSAELFAGSDPRRCRDSFDRALTKQCMRGEWEQKYHFDAESRECRLFWYDGCPGLTGSRNFFDSLLECQWLCDPGHQQSSICHEPFDEHLRDECDGSGNWRRHFYFDRAQRRCLPFLFDGCVSSCGNHFEDEISCRKKCGESVTGESASPIHYQTPGEKRKNYVPAWRLISTTTLRAPISGARERQGPWPEQRQQRLRVQAVLGTAEATTTATTKERRANSSFFRVSSARPQSVSPPSPSRMPPALSVPAVSSSTRPSISASISFSPFSSPSKSICAQQNPCQNGGTCVYDALMKQSICKCASPFTNDFCTERIDPCSPNPCKNGATCSAIAGPQRSEFDCFCARGFAGGHCEFRPCDDNPCKNGGTCRTTRSQSLFFCACPPGWGGKTCMIGFSSSGPLQLENANVTRQLSSGRAEWIDELRRVTAMVPKSEEPFGEEPIGSGRGFGKSALPSSSADGQHRSASAVSVVGFPRDQIVGNELPTRTLKGTTASEATNGAEKCKWTDGRGRHNSVPWKALAICGALIISLCFC